MELERASAAPGPLVLFCARLRRLQQASGIAQAGLARAVQLSTSQTSEILNGKIKRPPSRQATVSMVRACLDHAKKAGRVVPPDLSDVKDWERRLFDLEQDLDPVVRPKVSTESFTIREIADTLRSLPAVRPAPGAVAQQTWHERLRRWPNQYVERRTYHGRIKKLLAARRRAFQVGLPGMGKSRLACEAAIEVAQEIDTEAILLRGDTENTLLLDMGGELARRGIKVTDAGRVAREFAVMAEMAEPSPIIVIDNIEDARHIDQALPLNIRAMVIVTARTRLLDEDQWPAIEIDEMPADEAYILARTQLPDDVTDEGVARFAEALGGYPLAIVHGASLLRDDRSVSVDYFCRELARDASSVLDRRQKREQALTFIYRALLTRLQQAHAQAADLLKLMALPKRSQLPRTLVQGAFEAIPDYRLGGVTDDYRQIEFIHAVQMLESHVLVSVLPDELGIHQLVQALLRSLTRGGDSAPVAAIASAVNRWLRQAANQDRTTVLDWRPTIHALINATQGQELPPGSFVNAGDLLGIAMAAAVALNERDALTEVRQSWLYRWLTGESGAQDTTIAYVLQDWLSLSDSDYEPLSLALLPKRQPGIRLDVARKVSIAGAHDWGVTHDQHVRMALPNGSVRLIEPVHGPLNVARDLMLRGHLLDARKRGQSMLEGSVTDSDIATHMLLASIALRLGDVPGARHQLAPVQTQLSGPDAMRTRPLDVGRLRSLEGDIAHLEYLHDRESAATARKCYEGAQDAYQWEAIPLARIETERKLVCVRAHTNSQHAAARLQTLLLNTEWPLYEPLRHRMQLSLTKLAVIRSQVTDDHYEACWAAADFYAGSSTRDRYWYIESLLTAYTASLKCNAPAKEVSLLLEAVTREAPLIGRRDKADFASKICGGTANLARLLTD
jgi:adenylylsulfate kinase-like enzyme